MSGLPPPPLCITPDVTLHELPLAKIALFMPDFILYSCHLIIPIGGYLIAMLLNVYTRLPPSYFFKVNVSNKNCGLWGFDN